MNDASKFLLFNSHFDRTRALNIGRLSLVDIDNEEREIIKAWSGHGTKQYAECFHEVGGMLPPAYRCKGNFNWRVDTNPVYLPNHRGVRGNFYRISPFKVFTDKGGTRSDFGVHLDANVPGSRGCIVTDAKRFAEFEKWMRALKNAQVSSIPLILGYS